MKQTICKTFLPPETYILCLLDYAHNYYYYSYNTTSLESRNIRRKKIFLRIKKLSNTVLWSDKNLKKHTHTMLILYALMKTIKNVLFPEFFIWISLPISVYVILSTEPLLNLRKLQLQVGFNRKDLFLWILVLLTSTKW